MLLRIGDHKVDYTENYKKIPPNHVDHTLFMAKSHNVSQFLALLDNRASNELVDY